MRIKVVIQKMDALRALEQGKVAISSEALEEIKQVKHFDIVWADESGHNLDGLLRVAEAIITENGPIPSSVISKAPKLRAIINSGLAMENIDVELAREKGVVFLNCRSHTATAVAEHTVALMLALIKKILRADRLVRSFDNRLPLNVKGTINWAGVEGIGTLYGKTLGIIGMGEIGRLVGRYASGFGMKVIYCQCSRLPNKVETEIPAVFIPLDELLRLSDVISLHCTLTPETRHLLNKSNLCLVKDSVIIINTARGDIIEETELVNLLSRNRIAAVGLDTFSKEPLPNTHELARFDNVILTPHAASGTPGLIIKDAAQVFELLTQFFALTAGPILLDQL